MKPKNDLPVALIAENERLRSTIFTDNSATVAYATKRIAELQAEVERLKLQEPVAWMVKCANWSSPMVQVNKPTALRSDETLQPLFLASGAAQKKQKHD